MDKELQEQKVDIKMPKPKNEWTKQFTDGKIHSEKKRDEKMRDEKMRDEKYLTKVRRTKISPDTGLSCELSAHV